MTDSAAIRCDNCHRVGTPIRRTALLVDGAIVRERNLCSACLCHVREDAVAEPAPWLSYPWTTGSGRAATR